ncbi:MAG: shikimate kinase [Vampirovibrionales bacterium]
MFLQKDKSLIFLTGYMGAGKSTIGRRLAKQLGYKYTDTDKALEKKFKSSISGIFEKHGERVFRQAENELIERLSRRHHYVVSAGGGTLTRIETFYPASRSGVLVYLKAPVDVLFERAAFSLKDRPLLNEPDTENLFQERFKAREPYYTRSDFTVETHNRTSDDVIEDIIEWLDTPP